MIPARVFGAHYVSVAIGGDDARAVDDVKDVSPGGDLEAKPDGIRAGGREGFGGKFRFCEWADLG